MVDSSDFSTAHGSDPTVVTEAIYDLLLIFCSLLLG